MANTIDIVQNGTIICTVVPQTGADVPFTFNPQTYFAQVQCSASTTSMYFANASTGHAGFVLPFPAAAQPLELRDVEGVAVTFNGTTATNVNIIEYLRHS